MLARPDALGPAVAGRWGQAVAECAACVACALCARGLRGRARQTWALFALGEGIWAATDLAVGVALILGKDPSPPSVFDAFWIAFYVPMLGGVLLLYGRLRPERGWQGILDAILLAGALALFGWVLLLEPVSASASGGHLGVLVNLTYPALDLACAAALGWVVARHGRGAPPWLWWVVAAFGTTLVADVAYLLAYLSGAPMPAAVPAVAYMAAGWLWLAAAAQRSRWHQRAWGRATRSEPPAWSRAVPLAAALSAFTIVARDDGAIGFAVMAVAVAAAARVLVTLRVNRQLLLERESLLVTDPLTRAQNRRHLQYELPRLFARALRTGEPIAAVAFDLDGFKAVNDTYGHPAGDALLGEIAGAVASRLRLGDTLFRLGGDEFLVLMPATDARAAWGPALRIADTVSSAAEALIPGCGVTASIGVSSIPDDALTPADLLQNADAALYRAKRRGKALVLRFDRSDADDVPAGA